MGWIYLSPFIQKAAVALFGGSKFRRQLKGNILLNDSSLGQSGLGGGGACVTPSAAGRAVKIASGAHPGRVLGRWGWGESKPSHLGAKLFTCRV